MEIITSLILVYSSVARYWKLQLALDTLHLAQHMFANHTFQGQKIKDRPDIDNWFKNSQYRHSSISLHKRSMLSKKRVKIVNYFFLIRVHYEN